MTTQSDLILTGKESNHCYLLWVLSLVKDGDLASGLH